jgi:cell division protease FtsH
MSDNDPRGPQNKRPPNGGDPQFNWRGVALFAVAFALIAGAFIFRGGSLLQPETIIYPKFVQLVKAGQVISTDAQPLQLIVEQGSNTQYLSGFYKKTPTATPATGKAADAPVPFQVDVYTAFNGADILTLLKEAKLPYNIKSESNVIAQMLVAVLPIVLFLVVLYFFFRSQIKMAGKGAMSFGKSKA